MMTTATGLRTAAQWRLDMAHEDGMAMLGMRIHPADIVARLQVAADTVTCLREWADAIEAAA